MDLYTYGELLKTLKIKCENIKKIIQPDLLQMRLKELDSLSTQDGFWSNQELARKILKDKRRLQITLEKYQAALQNLNDNLELFEIAKADEDYETLELLYSEAQALENIIIKAEIEVVLNGEYDSMNAIITIQPGAGGTESQDWGSILYRMYLRYAERKGYKVELLDYQDGEEAGIKGVAFIIKGENAYGYLKCENGVHRLVRNSPFDSNDKRHTSFASVQVSPELDDDIEIVIEDKDIRIDTYRSSGAGGQHVNKTESAIRITHFPTGIVVQCQNDRSQHKNRATAMKMLASKLYALEKEKNTSNDDKGSNGWGHQIRSYVLTPYQQVKDLRSNFARSDSDNVLDGDLDDIIESVLVYTNKFSS
ncbi:peptide chain release factor 2 [Helicobacter muridarum]|uniref:Peptide chain release factor 2 n=1 Tax=Helicobacter muridarum TaxID=216 RepID=A0A099TWU1_9HELI|nr:peptide chain release factor 2 [Helicobacter muridarum]TLD98409.1 peptide chain release factor 2 [Helicobacter muridarum]STQ86165.1 peptide chain release factor 2 [Helicobacter muridarum]